MRFRALFVFTATVALFSASIFLLRAADGPEPPSQKTLAFENLILRMRFPDNWKATGQGSSYNIAPDDGMVFDTKGGSSVAYGVVMNLYAASDTIGKKLSLDDATGQLIQSLMRANRNLHVSGSGEHMKVNGRDCVSTRLTNDSPKGGKESDWLITTKQEDAVLYFVFVAPEADFGSYEGTFKNIVASIRWRH